MQQKPSSWKLVISFASRSSFVVFIVGISLYLFPCIKPATAQMDDKPTPLLAYYYIWFDEKSWDRAKSDYPILGKYSSDDRQVMTQHILWAQQAGIDGFIVSWKRTDVLDRRLQQLTEVAEELEFKLAIIYQGLDFERDPLPADKIASDIKWFISNYSQNPVFLIFNRPLLIWSGTWKFDDDDIMKVSQAAGNDLLILGSERNMEGYLRIADWVDGNAYYWSSVNPETTPGYLEKLDDMSTAIHERGGLWIAPAAPGFDARMIGGTRIVDRADGRTLLKEMHAAIYSSPDAIGLISWNEFSENSHIEPSQNYGMRYLEILTDLSGATIPVFDIFDSESPILEGTSDSQTQYRKQEWTMIIGLGILLLVLVGVIALRKKR